MLVVAVLLVATGTPRASAHEPQFFGPHHGGSVAEPFRVPDGDLSVAVYGRLGAGQRAAYLAIQLPSGAREPVEVLVPAGSDPRVTPQLAMQAPGGNWQDVAPLPTRERFDETYARVSYWRTHRWSVAADRAGWYTFRLTSPPGQRQQICVATGSREEIGLDAWLSVPRIWAWAGGAGGIMIHVLPAVVVAAALAAAAVLLRRRRLGVPARPGQPPAHVHSGQPG